jgi:hypothetical protein
MQFMALVEAASLWLSVGCWLLVGKAWGYILRNLEMPVYGIGEDDSLSTSVGNHRINLSFALL